MEKKSFMKKLTGSREALLAVILILLFAVITIYQPVIFDPSESLTDMLKNNAVTMVMALGMLLVMLVGGIDISIMSTLAFVRYVHWYASEK